MEWVRGKEIGYGSFSTVNLVVSKNPTPRFPQIMAVKSASVSQCDMLLRETSILEELGNCPHIIKCFGGEYSIEKGEKMYNLFLEYASGGTLADDMKKQPNHRFSESKVRRYTKSILEGIKYIHENGYAHCDLKLENILLFSEHEGQVKIADFGLATGERDKRSERGGGVELRGTPLYMSPETVASGSQGAPADVWAVGCLVAEMVAGAPAWRCRQATGGVLGLLMRIGVGDEVPEVPKDLSPEGRDFIEKIFVKDPEKRWTAQMLLDHPFVVDGQDCIRECFLTSPRGPLDRVGDDSPCLITKLLSSDFDTLSLDVCAERLRRVVTWQDPDWSETDSWISVRRY